jgi:hypothetical protein
MIRKIKKKDLVLYTNRKIETNEPLMKNFEISSKKHTTFDFIVLGGIVVCLKSY